MAKHQSPYTDWVFDAWYPLTFSENYTPENYKSEWQKLYSQCYEDGNWLVGLADAVLVSTVGLSAELSNDDFLGAKHVCERVLSHPGLVAGVSNEGPGLAHCQIWLAAAKARLGDPDAYEAFEEALVSTFQVRWISRIKIREALYYLNDEADRRLPPDPAFIDFALRLARDWPGGEALLPIRRPRSYSGVAKFLVKLPKQGPSDR